MRYLITAILIALLPFSAFAQSNPNHQHNSTVYPSESYIGPIPDFPGSNWNPPSSEASQSPTIEGANPQFSQIGGGSDLPSLPDRPIPGAALDTQGNPLPGEWTPPDSIKNSENVFRGTAVNPVTPPDSGALWNDDIAQLNLWEEFTLWLWKILNKHKRLFQGGGGDPLMFCLQKDKDCVISSEFKVGPKKYKTLQPEWLRPMGSGGWNNPQHPNYRFIRPFLFDVYNDGVKHFVDRVYRNGYMVFIDTNLNNKVDNCFEMLCQPGRDATQALNAIRTPKGKRIDQNMDGYLTDEDKEAYKYVKVLNTRTGKVSTPDELDIIIRLYGSHRVQNDNPYRKGRYSSLSCYVKDASYYNDLKEDRISNHAFPEKGGCFRFLTYNLNGVIELDWENASYYQNYTYSTVFSVYHTETPGLGYRYEYNGWRALDQCDEDCMLDNIPDGHIIDLFAKLNVLRLSRDGKWSSIKLDEYKYIWRQISNIRMVE